MARFGIPAKETLSVRNREILDNLERLLGQVPNLYTVMAYSPNGLAKYLAFQNAPSSLTIKEKEVVNLIVSQANDSRYCLNFHTHIAGLNDFSREEILKIRKGKASDPKLNALAVFTKFVIEGKGRLPAKPLNEFFAAGYSKENMVDVILQITDKTASNYVANLTKVSIDFPFISTLKNKK